MSRKHSYEVFAVVSGSFRRFLPQIQKVITELTKLDIRVLSPKLGNPVSETNGFVMLDSDKGSPERIEKTHLSAIMRSDFLYVVNPDGIIGPSVSLEIGYAVSHHVPIYCSNQTTDEVFRSLLVPDVPLSGIKRRITKLKRNNEQILKQSPTLADIQAFVSAIVKNRGFSDEDLSEVTLLLVEEIGELAKAIRVETGLKVKDKDLRERKLLRLELADCLIYLVDLANLANVSLEEAIREKESINKNRQWKRG